MLDNIEKLLRCVLWLAIASVLVLAPLSYIHMREAEVAVADSLRKAKDDAEHNTESAKSRRMSIGALGTFMTGLDLNQQEGHVTVTNVSPRAGILCLYGIARVRASVASSTSIPACRFIEPYASNEHLSVTFPHDVADLCSKASCDFEVRDAPENKDHPFVSPVDPATVPIGSLPAAH